MKRTIWHNDASQHYSWLEENKDEVRENLGLEEGEELTNEMLWEEAYRVIDADYEAECDNLANCDAGGTIVALGTVQRWNGARSGFAELTGRSVADIVRFVARVASNGDSHATLFVDDAGDIVMEMLGHDNPTNPTRMVFRALRRSVSEAGKQALLDAFYVGAGNRWTLAETRTKRLGHLPAAVYGWKLRQERKAA